MFTAYYEIVCDSFRVGIFLEDATTGAIWKTVYNAVVDHGTKKICVCICIIAENRSDLRDDICRED